MNTTTKTFGLAIRAGTINEAARSVRVIASTAALDSYDEIIEQDWDLARYQKNPTVLYAHNATAARPEDSLPIGHATDVAVIEGALEATVHFANALANPLAELVWHGVRQGSIRGVSVGFRPHGKALHELPDGRRVTKLLRPELFELSICPIGANPDAIVKLAAARATLADQIRAVPLRLRAEATAALSPDAPTLAELPLQAVNAPPVQHSDADDFAAISLRTSKQKHDGDDLASIALRDSEIDDDGPDAA